MTAGRTDRQGALSAGAAAIGRRIPLVRGILADRRREREIRRHAEPLPEGARGLFLDCGGNDGCSAVKFISANPRFDALSFEPNPVLWPYYATVPSRLVHKGVAARAGRYAFTVDPVDGDGSSIVAGKKIAAGIAPADLRVIEIDCVSLEDVLAAVAGRYDRIVLKLDVEGAEYGILEALLASGAIDRIDRVYAEFHWQMCGMPQAAHDDLLARVTARIEVRDWDGADFAVHGPDPARIARRRRWRDAWVRRRLGADLSRWQSPAVAP